MEREKRRVQILLGKVFFPFLSALRWFFLLLFLWWEGLPADLCLEASQILEMISLSSHHQSELFVVLFAELFIY